MYEAKGNYLVVIPHEETETHIDAENLNDFGIRQAMINGEPVKLSQCIPLTVLSSTFKEIGEGSIVYVRNSFINRIPHDEENYYIEEQHICLLEQLPYGDNVLCRDIVDSEITKGSITNAFVYHPGNSGLEQGDVIVYDYKHVNRISIADEDLFTIDKKYVVAVVQLNNK